MISVMHTDKRTEAEECRIFEHERENTLDGLETFLKCNLHCFLLVENGVGSF